MKRVMINQMSKAEIMYPNLYKGLRLKDKDLTKYDTPLVGFDGKMVIPVGQIKLHGVTEGKEVMVNFIEVHAFSPYIGILAWPCIVHAEFESEILDRLGDSCSTG